MVEEVGAHVKIKQNWTQRKKHIMRKKKNPVSAHCPGYAAEFQRKTGWDRLCVLYYPIHFRYKKKKPENGEASNSVKYELHLFRSTQIEMTVKFLFLW